MYNLDKFQKFFFLIFLLAFMSCKNRSDSYQVKSEENTSGKKSCRLHFPQGDEPSSQLDFSFEERKNQPFFLHTIADLSPCLIVQDRCEASKKAMLIFANAMATASEKIKKQYTSDHEGFLKALKAGNDLGQAVKLHAGCIADQKGGIPQFFENYSMRVSFWLPQASEGKVATKPSNDDHKNSDISNETPSARGVASAVKSLAVCKASFPLGDFPSAYPINFEKEKGNLTFVNAVASLTPCLLLEGRCSDSLTWVQHLAGAVGSVTQILKIKADGDDNKFLDLLMKDGALSLTVENHAACVKSQPKGLQGFLEGYTEIVKAWM